MKTSFTKRTEFDEIIKLKRSPFHKEIENVNVN